MNRRSRVAVVLAVALLASGCSRGAEATKPSRSGPRLHEAEAVALYGHGPERSDDFTYQDDVVLIEDGPTAIRSVSEDGLVWTMDAGARGMDELEVGSIMFASSAAAGRVVELDRQGDAVEVTLSPVRLTDIVRDGRITVDETLAVDDMGFRDIGSVPGAASDEAGQAGDPPPTSAPATEESLGTRAAPRRDGGPHEQAAGPAGDAVEVVELPPLQLVAGTSAARGAAAANELSTSIKGFTVTGYRRDGTLGVQADRETGGGSLKVHLDAHLTVSDLRLQADVPISRGVVGQSSFEVDGITGLEIDVQAGAGDGLSGNRNIKIEIPVQLTWPTTLAGFPATFTQKFKLLVQSAITAKNGNLSASGSWSLDGPLGFDGSTLTLPTMTERGTKLIDSIAGVSVGVNGLVVAVSFEFGLLVGVPAAGAGPIANLVTSLGLVNGSDLGIVKCKQSTLTATLTGGVGVSMLDPVRAALKKRLGVEIPEKVPLTTKDILKETWYDPQVAVCRP